jgi:hypothetical protein
VRGKLPAARDGAAFESASSISGVAILPAPSADLSDLRALSTNAAK